MCIYEEYRYATLLPEYTNRLSFNYKLNFLGAVMVENAKVLQADIKVTNGVVHLIDKVLLVTDHVSGESLPQSIG